MPKVILLLFVLLQMTLSAQYDIKVLHQTSDGNYYLLVNGDTLRTVNKKQFANYQKCIVELKSTQKEIEIKDSMIVVYGEKINSYDALLSKLRNYNSALEESYDGYKNLYFDLKSLKDPWISVSAGLGATNKDKWKPAVLLGLRIYQFNIWGFLQEENPGVIVGTNWALF